MSSINSYSVVDVETTGFSPRHHHRVLEIAVIKLAKNGEVLEEYETLVNPNRDVGPTHIHGIRPRDLKHAPEFGEVAGDVLALLEGSVFVAHNARFDWSFVEAEFSRLGVVLGAVPQLCTMEVSQDFDPQLPGRKLSVVCSHFNIPLDQHHRAIADARAVAGLLKYYIENDVENICGLSEFVVAGAKSARKWPSLPRSGKRCPRSDLENIVPAAPAFLSRMIERLPSYKDCTPATNSYLACLDDALSDRVISEEESADLQALAEGLGLLKEQVLNAHERYLRDLLNVALLDTRLTDSEMSDIGDVALLLGIPGDGLVRLLREHGIHSKTPRQNSAKPDDRNPFSAGKLICFTGTFQCEVEGYESGRDAAERLAVEKGLTVKSSVVKNLDYLVASDVETLSTKARKARHFGVPIISEEDYWRMMGFTTRVIKGCD